MIKEPIHRQKLLKTVPSLLTPTMCLGVTGHRDALDEEVVIGMMKEELLFLDRAYQPRKIEIHTPLARGADRWIVEALEQVKEEISATMRVQVVLPMREECYLETEAPEFRAELKSWLDRYREERVVLNKDYSRDDLFEDETGGADEEKKGERRKECFASLADYFAHHCDLLLAFWNGVKNGSQGGTADVIERVRTPGEAGLSRCRSVMWLPVSRMGHPFSAREIHHWESFAVVIPEKRKRTRPGWWKFPSIVLLTILTAVFGWYGYHAEGRTDRWDVILVSLSHILLENLGFAEQGAHHPLVHLSRFCGLLVLVISAGVVLEHTFKIWTRVRTVWISLREHDLVCGLGWRGKALVDDAEEQQRKMIAVDHDPDLSAIEICKYRKSALLVDDACATGVFGKVGLRNTRRAFICAETDEASMRIVHHLAKAYAQKGGASCWLTGTVQGICHRLQRKIHGDRIKSEAERVYDNRLVCSVGLESMNNFVALRGVVPANDSFDLRIFNAEAVTARLFLRDNHVDRFLASPDAKGARVVIVGDSVMADTMTRMTIEQGIFEEGKVLEVIRLVKDADAEARVFQERFPCYERREEGPDDCFIVLKGSEVWRDDGVLPDVKIWNLPGNPRGLNEWIKTHLASKAWVTTVIVAEDDPGVSSATAMGLCPVLEQIGCDEPADVALWFFFNSRDEVLRHQIELDLDCRYPNLHIRSFSDFLGNCSRQVATNEEADCAARRVNAAYWGVPLDHYLEVHQKWQLCTEDQKDSSRQCGEHCFVKLRIKKRLGLKGEMDVESLAKVEHRRWCVEKLLKGWKPLTAIPSKDSKFETSPREQEMIGKWFDDKNYKSRCQKVLQHVDLVPFDDFKKLFEKMDPGILKNEIEKDLNIVMNLEEIVYGSLRKPLEEEDDE